MFDSVLIANRGEIACRIARTLHRLGSRVIAVYSDADHAARHVALADEAVRLGPAPPAQSYLRIEAIIEAARRAGAVAVHPGYGFLSENAAFARACTDAGLTFIGPSAAVIELMGTKDRAKARMVEAGIPVVPGEDGADQDPRTLARAAERLGYPVLIKAAAGGGGKGMRIVRAPDAFPAALDGAKREARAAFGDDRVLLERFLEDPRHIEVQVFGDRYGNVVHLFERDCSLQRRHQKVIEEAPAPCITDELRHALGDAAVRAARAVGYTGAGTVEFLMSADGAFYFIEMNTRLQVEHPVTEMVTGLDLVEWQLRVAAGLPLPLTQEAITLSGHAIEARLYAEDAARGFLPATGRLDRLRFAAGSAAVRIESGAEEGDLITPHYDPMIAKVIAWAPERELAARRLAAALAESEVVGPATNLDFLIRTLRHERFLAGGAGTGLLEQIDAASEAPDDEVLAQAALWLLTEHAAQARAAAAAGPEPDSPWHRVDAWRLNDVAHQTIRLRAEGRVVEVDAQARGDGWCLRLGGRRLAARGRRLQDGEALIELEGRTTRVRGYRSGRRLLVHTGRGRFWLEEVDPLAEAGPADEIEGFLSAPMPGRIIRALVRAGDDVRRGAPLLVLEAMKMEHTLAAPADGRIVAMHYGEGEQVEEGAILIGFEASGEG